MYNFFLIYKKKPLGSIVKIEEMMNKHLFSLPWKQSISIPIGMPKIYAECLM